MHTHNFIWTTITEANGIRYEEELCSCGVINKKEIPALGHDWQTTSVANIGQVKVCKRCGIKESNISTPSQINTPTPVPKTTPVSVIFENKDTIKPIVYESKTLDYENQEVAGAKINVWDNVGVTSYVIRDEDKPKNGTISGLKFQGPSTILFNYMPNKGFTGTDEFSLIVYDSAGNKSDPGKKQL